MKWWKCFDCGNRISVHNKQCDRCGYKRNEYDLAAAAETTDKYLASRISYSSIDGMFDTARPSISRILAAIMIGVVIGIAVILIIRYFTRYL